MKLSQEEILFISALEKVSGVHARDCKQNNGMISFAVKTEDVGRAIGKKAVNAKKLQNALKKRIEIMELSKKPEGFVSKAMDIKVEESKEQKVEGKKVLILSLDSINRRKLLNNGGKLKRVKMFAERNYGVEVKIR